MAKKKTTKSKIPKTEIFKDSIIGFRGGLEIDLDRKMESGKTLEEELSQHIDETLSLELRNHNEFRAKLAEWNRQFKGYRSPKNFPFEDCANVCVPITRSNVDTTHVRIVDTIWNKRKVVIMRARKPEYADQARQIEEALDHFQKNILKLKDRADSPLRQAVKTGTGIVKLDFIEKTRTAYKYANDDELADSDIRKYQLEGTKEKAVKYIETLYKGPTIYPISREDFIISSDATSIDDAYLVGFKFPLRKSQIKLRVKQDLYRDEILDALTSPDKEDEIKAAKAEAQGKEIKKTDYARPYDFYELWLKYDVDEDGEEDDIVITWHHSSKTIAKAIFNPLFLNFRPFCPLVGYKEEFSFDGEGGCQILENLQVQIDTIINQMLDRGTLTNAIIVLIRAGTELADKFKSIKPGAVYPVDDDLEGVLREIKFSDVPSSNFNLLQLLISFADRAMGITPGVMGISTAERPVAKQFFGEIEEANKKFKNLIDNIRAGIIEIFYKLLEFFAQYQPTYSYTVNEGGTYQEKTINFPIEHIRDGFEIDLNISTELLSQEIRREINMTVYQLLSDYMTKVAGMAQMVLNPQAPPDLKQLILDGDRISGKILKRILEDFDISDAENLILSIEKSIDVVKAMAQQAMMQQPQAPQAEQPPTPQPGMGVPGMGT